VIKDAKGGKYKKEQKKETVGEVKEPFPSQDGEKQGEFTYNRKALNPVKIKGLMKDGRAAAATRRDTRLVGVKAT